MAFYVCHQCKSNFRSDRYSKYCSDACKMKAYRRRKDPLTGSYERQKERARNGVRTKADTTLKFICAQCGLEAYRTGTQALMEYCSDACKQKAYRARKKESSSSWEVGMRVLTDTGRDGTIKEMRGTTACIVTEKIGSMLLDRYHTLKRLTPVPTAPAAPVAPARLPETDDLFRCGGGPQGIQGLIERVGVAYRERYGHGWLFDDAKIVLRNGGYFAEIGDQSHYLNSFKHAKAAVIDYYERGVMNWSLVRDGMPVPQSAARG